jgi:hypothetical protein
MPEVVADARRLALDQHAARLDRVVHEVRLTESMRSALQSSPIVRSARRIRALDNGRSADLHRSPSKPSSSPCAPARVTRAAACRR